MIYIQFNKCFKHQTGENNKCEYMYMWESEKFKANCITNFCIPYESAIAPERAAQMQRGCCSQSEERPFGQSISSFDNRKRFTCHSFMQNDCQSD